MVATPFQEESQKFGNVTIFSQHFSDFGSFHQKNIWRLTKQRNILYFVTFLFFLLQPRTPFLSNLAPTNLPSSNWPIATVRKITTIDDSLKICKQFAKKTSFGERIVGYKWLELRAASVRDKDENKETGLSFLVCLLKISSSPDLCLFLVKWQKEYVIAVFRGIDDLYSQDQTPSSARPTLEHSLGQSSRLLQKSWTLGITR